MTLDPAAFVSAHHAAITQMVKVVGTRICRDRGWDLEDLLSDVIVQLLAKQQSARSRFDPTRSPLDFYLRKVVQSVIGHWLEREDAAKRIIVTLEMETYAEPHEGGLDDVEVARLNAVLGDARRVLVDSHDTAYRTLVAWLVAEEVDVIAGLAGLTALDVLRYLAKALSRLERPSQPRWRAMWMRHRVRVYRQIQSERAKGGTVLVPKRPRPPLKRVQGAG